MGAKTLHIPNPNHPKGSSTPYPEMKERLRASFERAGKDLQTSRGRRQLFLRLHRKSKLFLGILFLLYTLFLSILLILAGWIGERNLFFAFILFVPAQVWILPYFVFAGMATVLLSWRLILLTLFSACFFAWAYLDWESSGGRSPKGGGQLTILTFNRGERSGSLQPFKNSVSPDIIVFQEAPFKSKPYLKSEGYESYTHGEDIGEFTLLSRFPITEKELLTCNLNGIPLERAMGARFEVDFNGAPIAVYNIHLRTPRETLKAMRRGAFIWGLIGIPGTAWGDKRTGYESFWDGQIEIARQLVTQLESEKLPFIVAGDFNAPDHGYINGLFDGEFNDAHEEAGHRFGYTFPGSTRNPLSLFTAWLRLDKIYCNDSWRTINCVTERGRSSQHLSVAATFELSSP
jgi:vancomycin resistance protein VanJ